MKNFTIKQFIMAIAITIMCGLANMVVAHDELPIEKQQKRIESALQKHHETQLHITVKTDLDSLLKQLDEFMDIKKTKEPYLVLIAKLKNSLAITRRRSIAQLEALVNSPLPAQKKADLDEALRMLTSLINNLEAMSTVWEQHNGQSDMKSLMVLKNQLTKFDSLVPKKFRDMSIMAIQKAVAARLECK